MTMTKADLTDGISDKFNLDKLQAKSMVDTIFELVRNSLQEGEPVKISGFGNFELRDKSERPGRNPKTGQEVQVNARRVVTFHAGQKLKSIVTGVDE